MDVYWMTEGFKAEIWSFCKDFHKLFSKKSFSKLTEFSPYKLWFMYHYAIYLPCILACVMWKLPDLHCHDLSWKTEFNFEQSDKWSFYMLTNVIASVILLCNVMLQAYCMFSTKSYSGLVSLAFVKWTPYRCCLSDLTLKNSLELSINKINDWYIK